MGGNIEFSLSYLSGDSFTIETHVDSTLRDLHRLIALKRDIPVEGQRLIHSTHDGPRELAGWRHTIRVLLPACGHEESLSLVCATDDQVRWVASAMRRRHVLADAPFEIRDDRYVIQKAIIDGKWGPDGFALQYASERLRGDRDLVLEAVQADGLALEYASQQLQGDREVVQEAMKHDPHALEHASKELRADKDVVLLAVKRDRWTIEYASEELRTDMDVRRATVAQADWHGALDADEALTADRKAIMLAIRQDWRALKRASSELRADPEVVQAAIKMNGLALKYASLELQGDKQVVLAAVEENGLALEHSTAALKADPDVVRTAVASNGAAAWFAAAELMRRQDYAVLCEAMDDALYDKVVFGSDDMPLSQGRGWNDKAKNKSFAEAFSSSDDETYRTSKRGKGMALGDGFANFSSDSGEETAGRGQGGKGKAYGKSLAESWTKAQGRHLAACSATGGGKGFAENFSDSDEETVGRGQGRTGKATWKERPEFWAKAKGKGLAACLAKGMGKGVAACFAKGMGKAVQAVEARQAVVAGALHDEGLGAFAVGLATERVEWDTFDEEALEFARVGNF